MGTCMATKSFETRLAEDFKCPDSNATSAADIGYHIPAACLETWKRLVKHNAKVPGSISGSIFIRQQIERVQGRRVVHDREDVPGKLIGQLRTYGSPATPPEDNCQFVLTVLNGVSGLEMCKIDIMPEQTLLDVKKGIQRAIGAPLGCQRLMLHGQILGDGALVSCCCPGHPQMSKASNANVSLVLKQCREFVHDSDAVVVIQPADGLSLFHALAYGFDEGCNATSLRQELRQYIQSNPGLDLHTISSQSNCHELNSFSGMLRESYDFPHSITIDLLCHMKSANIHIYKACQGGYAVMDSFDGGIGTSEKIVNLVLKRALCYDVLLLHAWA